MTLYARADLQSVSIPVTSGGCGQTHSRPVDKWGHPDPIFALDCPGCEHFLKGGGKTVIRVTPGNKEYQIPSRMDRVPDLDPVWANSPESIPMTRTEELAIGENAMALVHSQQRTLAKGISRLAKGQDISSLLGRLEVAKDVPGMLVCSSGGHHNAAGSKFCAQCGVPLRYIPKQLAG